MKPFSWKTPEYFHTPKNRDWYLTVGIISSALVITAIIFGNVLFGVVIALGAFVLTLFASTPAHIIEVDVTQKGIAISNILYPFSSLESFSIDENHPHAPRLYLKLQKPLMPLVSVPIQDVSIESLKKFLEKYLKKENFEPSLVHSLLEKMGF